jgi:hypothetical protein
VTAIIINLAGWRMRRSALPSAMDVAIDQIMWLRAAYPGVHPRTAAAMLGLKAESWAQVIELYAAAWEALPEEIRRA